MKTSRKKEILSKLEKNGVTINLSDHKPHLGNEFDDLFIEKKNNNQRSLKHSDNIPIYLRPDYESDNVARTMWEKSE